MGNEQLLYFCFLRRNSMETFDPSGDFAFNFVNGAFNAILSEVIYDELMVLMEQGEMPDIICKERPSCGGNVQEKQRKSAVFKHKERRAEYKDESPMPDIQVNPDAKFQTEKSKSSKSGIKFLYHHRYLNQLYDINENSTLRAESITTEAKANVQEDEDINDSVLSDKPLPPLKKEIILEAVNPIESVYQMQILSGPSMVQKKETQLMTPAFSFKQKGGSSVINEKEEMIQERQKVDDIELKSIKPTIDKKNKLDLVKLSQIETKNEAKTPAKVQSGQVESRNVKETSKPKVEISKNGNKAIPIEQEASIVQMEKDKDDRNSLASLGPDESSNSNDQDQLEKVKGILQEKSKEKDFKSFIKDFQHTFQDEEIVAREPSQSMLTKIFRIINFIRALITTGYGLYVVLVVINQPEQVRFGAKYFQYITCAFLFLDLIITAVKAFPKVFLFWKRVNSDFFAKSFSIWQLVSDLELILDVAPLMANVCLKVYAYRFNEILLSISTVNLGDEKFNFTPGVPLTSELERFTKTKYFNFSLLVTFAGTTFVTLLFHFFRIYRALIGKYAFTLAHVVFVKFSLLAFDLMTNAFLLYTVLMTKGNDLFSLDLLTNLTISVVATTMIVTLTTNFLVNFPLHYAFIQLLLRTRVPAKVRNQISSGRIWRGALHKTFHPLIVGIVGLIASYNVAALAYILIQTRKFQFQDLVAVSINFTQSNLLYAALWLNLVMNYVCGIVATICYLVFVILKSTVGNVLLNVCGKT